MLLITPRHLHKALKHSVDWWPTMSFPFNGQPALNAAVTFTLTCALWFTISNELLADSVFGFLAHSTGCVVNIRMTPPMLFLTGKNTDDNGKCVWLWLKQVCTCFNVFTAHSQPLFDVKKCTNVQIKDTHNWSVSYLQSLFSFMSINCFGDIHKHDCEHKHW